MNLVTNYDLLKFLVADGGSYTRSQHVALLCGAFPTSGITEQRVTDLRSIMRRSRFVTVNVRKIDRYLFEIRVLDVADRFGRYTLKHERHDKAKAIESHLLSEPPEVVRAITLVQQFDELTRPYAARNRERLAQCR